MTHPPLKTFTACRSSRGGFTLVELLVVIGIIAILAGVALGPITQGLEKAKESAGMQTARTIALSEFQYSVDNTTYPGGANSGDVAGALIAGGYITDPSVFAASKGTAATVAAGATATQISGDMTTAAEICWDFMASSTAGTGLSTSDPDGMPVVFSTGQTLVIPQQGPSNTPLTMNTVGGNPFNLNGMAICYHSNSAVFLRAVAGQINTSVNNYVFNSSFACTPGNYTQLKPTSP